MLRCLLPIVLVLSSWEAAGRDVLFRGSGVLTKLYSKSPNQQITQDFVATAVLKITKSDELQIGYKAVFSDKSEKTLALELTEDASTGEAMAQIRTTSGNGQGELSDIIGVVAETENGYHVVFKKEDESLLEVVVDIHDSPTNIGGDLIPDVHMTITTNDWSASDSSDPAVFNLKLTSRLDFNALMRNDDNSFELLVEELFGN